MERINEIVVYQPDEILSLEVHIESDSVWLSLNQMSILFGRDKSVISRHISNIYKERELEKDSTVAKNATVQIENGRSIVRQIEYFNLDVIISVGYRVKSQRPFLVISLVSHILTTTQKTHTLHLRCH